MGRLAPLILVLAVVVFAGCGSAASTTSGGSTSADTSVGDEGSLSKAEFIAKADALCEAAKAKQQPLRATLQQLVQKARGEEASTGTISAGTRRGLARGLAQVASLAEADLAKVRGLGSPSAGASQLEAIFEQTESAFALSRAYGVALEAEEDAKAQQVAEEGDAETRETAALAKQYGFKVCGSAP